MLTQMSHGVSHDAHLDVTRHGTQYSYISIPITDFASTNDSLWPYIYSQVLGTNVHHNRSIFRQHCFIDVIKLAILYSHLYMFTHFQFSTL